MSAINLDLLFRFIGELGEMGLDIISKCDKKGMTEKDRRFIENSITIGRIIKSTSQTLQDEFLINSEF